MREISRSQAKKRLMNSNRLRIKLSWRIRGSINGEVEIEVEEEESLILSMDVHGLILR